MSDQTEKQLEQQRVELRCREFRKALLGGDRPKLEAVLSTETASRTALFAGLLKAELTVES